VNRYEIGDITVGMSESFTVTVTADMMNDFLKLTGDVNPLHCDEDFAKQRGFSGRVVYGMLSASLYSTLAGVYLPGEKCLLQRVDTKFKKPVFIGDTLTVTGTVTDVSEALSHITVKATIVNQKGEKVNAATIEAGVI